MTYNNDAKFPSLEKIVLTTVEPVERVSIWANSTGAIYEKDVNHYTVGVNAEATNLVDASSTSLSSGEWYFDAINKKVYARLDDDSNPDNTFMSIKYRLFFADVPVKLPYDLVSGNFEVDWLPYIKSISNFPQGIDSSTQFGIALESSGRISFFNNTFFKDYYDTLFFENKDIVIYSYLPTNKETKKIFSGEITDKAYNPQTITFSIRDFVHKLQQPVSANLFSSSDGSISDSVIGRPKRTIYGQVDGMQIQSIDQVLAGYDLTGTVKVVANSTALDGTSTEFLKEVSPNDDITFTIQGTDYTYKVDSVISDTLIGLGEVSAKTGAGLSVTDNSEIPYRYKNRAFMVSGHKLRSPSTTITSVTDLRRFDVADISDLFSSDTIKVDTTNKKISRISNSTIVLTDNLSSLPSISDTVTKNPINKVYFNKLELVIDRDWSISNTDECTITFEDDAEFNHTNHKVAKGVFTFTNGSRDVSATSSKITTDFKIRDWIRTDDTSHTTWYEILDLTDDNNLILRVAYAGTNRTSPADKKNVKYIDDNSVVTVNCVGKENSAGTWIKTASDTVSDLLAGAGITNIDTDSFTTSKEEAPYIISLAIPLDPSSKLPKTRDIIGLINKSVFGSLVTRNDYTIAYDVLSPARPTDVDIIKEDDLKSFSIRTVTDIIKKFIARYRHQDSDRFTGENARAVESYTSSFVNYVIGTTKEQEENIYLYDSGDAQTIAQRYTFYKSLTQSNISLRGGGLYLSDKQINEKIYVSLDHLYKRYGTSNDTSKIMIINSISKDGNIVSIDASDLGNIFNRSASIASNISAQFTGASANELIVNGYIVANDTELPGTTANEIGINLIS